MSELINHKQYIISDNGTRAIPIEVEKPNPKDVRYLFEPTNPRFNQILYEGDLQAYNTALEEGKKHALPIVGAHNWKDGEVVTEGVDFEIQERYVTDAGNGWKYVGDSDNKGILEKVLVPIPPILKKKFWSQDEYGNRFCDICGSIDIECKCDERVYLPQTAVPIPHTDHRGEESKDWNFEPDAELKQRFEIMDLLGAELKFQLDINEQVDWREVAAHIIDFLSSKNYKILSTTPESREESEAVAFGKWLQHLDNGTKEKSDSIGFSPSDCFIDETMSVEELYEKFKGQTRNP